MNVAPGVFFEAVVETGQIGLSTVGAELNDNLGSIIIPFTATATEIAPGVFSVVMTAPSVLGQYSIVWREFNGGPVLGVEDLTVTGQAVPPFGPPPTPLPITGGLTYKQIQDECVNFRFGEGRRSSIKYWINRRYQGIWGEAEWPFKRVNRQQANVLNGQITMPVGFRRSIALEDSDGNLMEFRDPEQFRNDNPLPTQGQEAGGSPGTYTVWNGQIILDATPGEGSVWWLSYLRRLCVRDKDGFLREGLLAADGDYPIWDPEHHFLLVLGATSTGLKLENDFTWQALEDEFQAAITEMKDDLLPPDTVGTTQYGADDL